MARQTPLEDIFTPIHKGIRCMIYDLGTKLWLDKDASIVR
jgi:hypothetical protein